MSVEPIVRVLAAAALARGHFQGDTILTSDFAKNIVSSAFVLLDEIRHQEAERATPRPMPEPGPFPPPRFVSRAVVQELYREWTTGAGCIHDLIVSTIRAVGLEVEGPESW